MKGLPLNVICWCRVKKEDGTDGFEVLDGQKRTISLCEYMDGSFYVEDRYFCNLPSDWKKRTLDYPLFVLPATARIPKSWSGSASSTSPGCISLTRSCATPSMPARGHRTRSAISPRRDYLKGASIRQEYQETAILWAASAEGKSIEAYMAEHQGVASAVQLWNHFRSVIDWVQAVFPKKRREMKGLPWGLYYNRHGRRTDLDSKKLETEIQRLMGDDDVTKKSGIYEYLLTGEEKKLSIRAFDRRDALAAYEKQGHACAICGKQVEFGEMHADHVTLWSKGGRTVPENCQMLCRDCNLRKGAQ